MAPERDPRHALADWMAEPSNRFFAPALVNRYWKHFFARGIVDPEDDLRVTNPATNPELLDALSQHFVEIAVRPQGSRSHDLQEPHLSTQRRAESTSTAATSKTSRVITRSV
ncbi:MAG: DUF1553 domain-containing protein [Pirellulales bacterium]